MKNKTEGIFAIVAALAVLFSNLWNPRISMIISVAALLLLGLYEITKRNQLK